MCCLEFCDGLSPVPSERFLGFLVTHDVEEAVALADRVLVMEDGRIIAENQIDLPRPRDRNSPEFIVLKEYLLESLMSRRGET
jgi:sulfonate transport system ATP-binding protein